MRADECVAEMAGGLGLHQEGRLMLWGQLPSCPVALQAMLAEPKHHILDQSGMIL